MILRTSRRRATTTTVVTVLLATTAVLLAACSGSAPLAPTTPSGSPSETPSETPSGSVPSPSPDTSTPTAPETTDSASGSTSDPPVAPVGPAITMLSPAAGATLPVPLTLSGTANTFEAALTVDARNAAGQYLCIRHIMATSGSGTPGTWQTRLAFPPPHESGTQPVTLRAYEVSADDGSIIHATERQIMLSATRPAIVMATPACGDVVSPGSQIAVTGVATVFEAALTVELRDAAGTVRLSTNLMSAEGGVESDFSDMITIPAGLPGGHYDLVAFSFSPKDGSKENEFPVQILVQ